MDGTYVVSDIHGFLEDLERNLAAVGLVTDGRWTGGDAQLWVLGDLTDRGPDGSGVLALVRSLTAEAPEHVHMLLGNHDALLLARRLFPQGRLAELGRMNGGWMREAEALTDDDVAWLRGLPAMALVGGDLLMHTDTVDYLDWGGSVAEINSHVAALLASDDADDHFKLFATLTNRYDFADEGSGGAVAAKMLRRLGGTRIVHGHSIISTLTGGRSACTTGPLSYADELVLAIDGGRYDDGPLLVVRLDQPA